MLLTMLAVAAATAAAARGAALTPLAGDDVIPETADGVRALFERFEATYRREYASAELREAAAAVFAANMARARRLNALRQHDSDAVFGVSKFADVHPELFASRHLMRPFTVDEARAALPAERRASARKSAAAAADEPKPAAFDWRPRNAVTRIKNQKDCGSCWSFSIVEAVESQWLIAGRAKNASALALSPEQLVDCVPVAAGCDGGSPPVVLQYMAYEMPGLMSAADYPYDPDRSHWHCQYDKDKVVAKIKTWEWATSYNNEAELAETLASTGPPSVCVDAANWDIYKRGIMTPAQCGAWYALDHAIQAVAFNTTANPPYWVLRNSWAADWGEDGFIRVAYGHNTCGVATVTTVPVV